MNYSPTTCTMGQKSIAVAQSLMPHRCVGKASRSWRYCLIFLFLFLHAQTHISCSDKSPCGKNILSNFPLSLLHFLFLSSLPCIPQMAFTFHLFSQMFGPWITSVYLPQLGFFLLIRHLSPVPPSILLFLIVDIVWRFQIPSPLPQLPSTPHYLYICPIPPSCCTPSLPQWTPVLPFLSLYVDIAGCFNGSPTPICFWPALPVSSTSPTIITASLTHHRSLTPSPSLWKCLFSSWPSQEIVPHPSFPLCLSPLLNVDIRGWV